MRVYTTIKSNNTRLIRIFGIKVLEQHTTRDVKTLKILGGIFNMTQTNKGKKIYILGLQVWTKKISKPQTCNIYERVDYFRIANMQQRIITTALLHQKTFGPFKGIYKNQTAVLVAAGPTVNFYTPIKNAIHVGCNRAFKKENIKFDYLFTIDKAGLLNYADEFKQYECIKFIGDQNLGVDFQIPEDFSNSPNTFRYKTNVNCLQNNFYVDIDSSPLVNAATVAIQAMQFILFTQPKQIFLVGTDCTVASKQHFIGGCFDISKRGESASKCDEVNIDFWKRLKNFATTYYPNTEIISINPVRLTGVFRDVYTQSYLDANPDIKKRLGDKIELLENVIEIAKRG